MSKKIKYRGKTLISPEDISLFTLIVWDSAESANAGAALLKKYGYPVPTSRAQLEEALAALYFSGIDKIQLEKELAAIHPHKKFIEKYSEPKVIEKVIEVPKPVQVQPDQAPIVPPTKEIVSSADGQGQYPCRGAGLGQYIGLVAVIGTVALAYVMIQKQKA